MRSIAGSLRQPQGASNGSRAWSRALVSSDGWRRISERYCRSYHPCLSAWAQLAACGWTARNPAILWRYAGTSSTRLSRCRLRAAAEFHGAGRNSADTEARRAQACPLAKAEAEYTSSGAASSRAAAAGEESVRRDEDTRTAQEDTRTAQADTRTGGLEGRARSAAVRARRQQRWPHSSGIAACAKRRDRPDEVSGGRP